MDTHSNILMLYVFKILEKTIKGIKGKDFNEIRDLVLEKIKKDKNFIQNETNIKKIIAYFQKKCLTQEGINSVGLVLQPKKKSSKKGKVKLKGGSGLEVYAAAALGAAAAWYILNNNFCKWNPDKCTKEADGTIKEPKPADKTKIINEMCMNTDNPFMKVACLGAPETPVEIEKVVVQNNNITNFVDVIENNTIVVNGSNIEIKPLPSGGLPIGPILLHDLIVNVTNEEGINDDSILNFTHLLPKVVSLSKPYSKVELITWVKKQVKEQVKTVPPSQIAKWITRAKKFRVKSAPPGIAGPKYNSVWSGPGGDPERFLSAKLQQLIDTKGGFIEGKFHPKGIEWKHPPRTWSKKGDGNPNSVQTRTQRERQRNLNLVGENGQLRIPGPPRPLGITHVKPALKPQPPLPPFVSNAPLSIFGIVSEVVTKLSQTNNGNLYIWIALVIYTFGIILCISILMKTLNYMFKTPQPELSFNPNQNSKLVELGDEELFPGLDKALEKIDAEEQKKLKEEQKKLKGEEQKLKKMKATSAKNAASVGLKKSLKREKAELEKKLRQTKVNHNNQITKMIAKQFAKQAIKRGVHKASKKALNNALTKKHRQNMTKMVAKHAANTASKKASQKALTKKHRQNITKMVGTHASLKASKKSLEKEIELKFADFANKLNASLQNQAMFSGAIQQGSFNIQQLMMMLQQNVSEKQKLEATIVELNETLKNLNEEIDVQIGLLGEQEEEIEKLQTDYGQLYKDIVNLTSVKDTSEESLLLQEMSNMIDIEIKNLSQTESNDKRRAELEEKSRRIKNKDENIHTLLLNDHLVLKKSYDGLKEELQKTNNEIQENQNTITEKESEIAKLKNELRQLGLKVKEISASKVQNEDAKTVLAKEIRSHLETIRQNKEDIKGLQSDNDELYAVNTENSLKLISQNVTMQKLTDEFNKKTEQLSGSQNERSVLVDLNEALKAENELLKTENDTLNEISEKYDEIMEEKEELEELEGWKQEKRREKLEKEQKELEEERAQWQDVSKKIGKKRMLNIRSKINRKPTKESINEVLKLTQGTMYRRRVREFEKMQEKTKRALYKAQKESHIINTQLKALSGKKPDAPPKKPSKKGSPLKPKSTKEKRANATKKVLKRLGLTNNNVLNLNLKR
jgi:hypothetical protein